MEINERQKPVKGRLTQSEAAEYRRAGREWRVYIYHDAFPPAYHLCHHSDLQIKSNNQKYYNFTEKKKKTIQH